MESNIPSQENKEHNSNTNTNMNSNSKPNEPGDILPNNNFEFLISTLKSFETNVGISIDETKSKILQFQNLIQSFTKTFTKVSKCLINNLQGYITNFKDIKSKFESKIKFINDLNKVNQESPMSLSLIKEETQLNNFVTQEQYKLVTDIVQLEKCEKLIRSLLNLPETKEFMSMNIGNKASSNNNNNNDEDLTESIINENNSEDGNINGNACIDKDNGTKKVLGKKRKTNKDGEKETTQVKKRKSTDKKKAYRTKDILTQLKKKYNNIPYIKKITKTFISRRLNHKIIYEHSFNYEDSNNLKENKIKTIGDKFQYKYHIFMFKSIRLDKREQLLKMFQEQMKNKYFLQHKPSDKTAFIIGGKGKDGLLEFIERVFRSKEFAKEYEGTLCTIYSYEFYEELANEFINKKLLNNNNEGDINDINNNTNEYEYEITYNDKELNNFKENWKHLCLVREYVKQKKEK